MSDDPAEAVAILGRLSVEDRRQVAQMADPHDVALLLRSYQLATTIEDRSLFARAETYFSTMSIVDWKALLLTLAPALLAIV